MSNHILKLFFQVTGGRPMKLINLFSATDKITGRQVHLYQDRLHGAYWLATGPWSNFRLKQPGAESRLRPPFIGVHGRWRMTPWYIRMFGYPIYRRKVWTDAPDVIAGTDVGVFYWEYSNEGEEHE